MSIIIPIILLVVSGTAIGYVIGKKIPLLRSLDSASLSGELNLEVKKAILEERLKRRLSLPFLNLLSPVRPWFRRAGLWLQNIYKSILDKERELRTAATKASLQARPVDEQIEVVEERLQEAELTDRDDETETRYLEILELDPKNIEAYEGLAELFIKRRELRHARELYEHLLKLGSTKVEHYLALAETWLLDELFPKAARVLKDALKVHPKNPKLLDKLLNIAILLKDSGLAKDYLKRLVEINPDNQKIQGYRKAIKAL